MQRSVVAAINSRRVPADLQEPLTSRVNELVARCAAAGSSERARKVARWIRKSSEG